MGYKIWVDDVRPMPIEYDICCRSVEETIETISYIRMKAIRNIDLISLDHDAGDYYDAGGDFIEVLKWFADEHIDDIPIAIHSGNPVGARRMRQMIDDHGWTYVEDPDEILYDVIF